MTKHHTISPKHGQRARRPAAPHAWLFMLASLVAAVGVWVSYQFYVNTSIGQYIDESALDEAAAAKQVIGTQTSQWLDLLPVTSVVIAAVVVLFVTLARRRWKAAGLAVAAMLLANLTTQLIKIMLPLRPDKGVVTLGLNSLPSGHSTLAASAAAAVLLVVSPRWRPAAAFLGGTYAVLSGLSTLVNQWHRPADVVSAFLVVAFWTSLAALVILRTGRPWNVWSGYRESWSSSWKWPVLSLVLALGSAGLMAAMLIPEIPIGRTHSSHIRFFWAGVAQITMCGYFLTVAGTLLFGWEARRRNAR